MAQYEHLPIYKAAFDLQIYFEGIVRNFTRYHKYTHGAALRDLAREALMLIVRANNCRDKLPVLEELRIKLEELKVVIRICKEVKAFPNAHGEGIATPAHENPPRSPFLGEDKFCRRWQRERTHRVIYDDIRDLEKIKEISLLELLAEELPRRVGSPLSIKNLREVLEVAHETVNRWVLIFERMYYCFRIPPHGAPRIRAVKKEQKLYLWDWTAVPDPGARFENLVACQLLKYCHFVEDSQGYGMDLRFLRDTDKREVDFVVLQEGRPLFAVECKTGEKDISPALFYFKERVDIPNCYQVHTGTRDYEKEGIRVLPFSIFCSELKMP